MDFGSVGPARTQVTDRKLALSLTEECAQKCTGSPFPSFSFFHFVVVVPESLALCAAPFRAPEIHDVPSDCVITEKIDVWSLGCTLYAMLYGQSPFDGSATSAMSGQIKFPATSTQVPPEVHTLIKDLLQVDPEKRPGTKEIEDRILALGL